jgi:hypothetical protein
MYFFSYVFTKISLVHEIIFWLMIPTNIKVMCLKKMHEIKIGLFKQSCMQQKTMVASNN